MYDVSSFITNIMVFHVSKFMVMFKGFFNYQFELPDN